LSLTRVMQDGHTVCRSRSCSVKSAPQCEHDVAPFARGALHDEQRTTEASWARKRGTSTTSPQAQWNRLPAEKPLASNWRLQAGQATRQRVVDSVAVVTVVLRAGRARYEENIGPGQGCCHQRLCDGMPRFSIGSAMNIGGGPGFPSRHFAR
jgi:hypothetical protein